MATFVCFGLLIDRPALGKPWLLALLIIVLLAWILNVALTAVLRCGREGQGRARCASLLMASDGSASMDQNIPLHALLSFQSTVCPFLPPLS